MALLHQAVAEVADALGRVADGDGSWEEVTDGGYAPQPAATAAGGGRRSTGRSYDVFDPGHPGADMEPAWEEPPFAYMA